VGVSTVGRLGFGCKISPSVGEGLELISAVLTGRASHNTTPVKTRQVQAMSMIPTISKKRLFPVDWLSDLMQKAYHEVSQSSNGVSII